MKRARLIGMGVLSLAVVMAICFAGWEGQAAKKKAYKIGAVFAVTGPASSLGEPEKQTAEMVVEEINAAGGINGHPLELVIYDTEGNPDKCVNKVQRLINNDKVLAIMGPSRSATSMPLIPIVTKAKIPLVSCAASYKIVTDENGDARKWVFKTPQSDSLAVEKIYGYCNKNGISRVALMTVNNGFGDSGRSELKRMAGDFNIDIVADELFGQDDPDMIAQLNKIKGKKAQAVICWAVQKAPAIVAKNMKQLGMKIPLIQSHGVASKMFIELCGDAAEGIILPAGRLIVAEALPDSNPQKKMLVEYKNAFEEKHGPVSTFGGHAYDALKMLAVALEKGGDDPAKIRDELEKIQGFAGTGGIFNMSATDHNGLTKEAFVMVKIHNGEWEIIPE